MTEEHLNHNGVCRDCYQPGGGGKFVHRPWPCATAYLLQRVRELEALLYNIHQNSVPQPTKNQADWVLDIIHKLTAPANSEP